MKKIHCTSSKKRTKWSPVNQQIMRWNSAEWCWDCPCWIRWKIADIKTICSSIPALPAKLRGTRGLKIVLLKFCWMVLGMSLRNMLKNCWYKNHCCKFLKLCINIHIGSVPFFHNPATNSNWHTRRSYGTVLSNHINVCTPMANYYISVRQLEVLMSQQKKMISSPSVK